MSKLDNIRQKLQQQQFSNTGKSQRDNSVFPHWDIPTNTTTSLRFLPDGNEDNIFFWVERQLLNLPFKGIKGTDYNKDIIVKAPCNDMFKPKSCPVTQEIVPWFNTDMDSYARKYWKNRSYLFQGFVISTDMEEANPPENPIRRFIMSKSIFKIIQDSILDADNFDQIPTDYENGVNFKIKKTQNGQYADYSTSSWDRKESALTEDQLRAIDEHGLYDLSTFLPNRPKDEELEVIFEMFKASLDEQPYDPEKWRDFYAPWGLDKILDENGVSTTSMGGSSNTKNDSNDDSDTTPSTTDDASTDSSSDDDQNDDNDNNNSSSDSDASANAQDILQQLKARASKNNG